MSTSVTPRIRPACAGKRSRARLRAFACAASRLAKGTYLHNALGQRVFKSEPKVDHVAPNASTLGAGFVAWLQSNFSWLFAQAQANATLGQSYVYDDALGDVPVLLGEYGNGGSNSSGRREYLWLPVNGQAMPIGVYTNTTLHAVHADHLNTPRLVAAGPTSTSWQWPYSAFGDERPVDQLVELSASSLRTPYLVDYASGARLYAFEPSSNSLSIPDSIMNLRYPGQYFDSETGLNYNYFRSYLPSQGRYAQPDPIGLEGGLNRFVYVEGNPLMYTDPLGLDLWCKDKSLNIRVPMPRGKGGGCGDSATDKYIPDTYPEACYAHDSCYANSGPTRSQCDRRFLRDMITESGPQPNILGPLLYYGGVRLFGGDAFRKARQ